MYNIEQLVKLVHYEEGKHYRESVQNLGLDTIRFGNDYAFAWLSYYGQLSQLKWLHECGANVENRDNLSLRNALVGKKYDTVQWLISVGVNIKASAYISIAVNKLDMCMLDLLITNKMKVISHHAHQCLTQLDCAEEDQLTVESASAMHCFRLILDSLPHEELEDFLPLVTQFSYRYPTCLGVKLYQEWLQDVGIYIRGFKPTRTDVLKMQKECCISFELINSGEECIMCEWGHVISCHYYPDYLKLGPDIPKCPVCKRYIRPVIYVAP